MTPKEKSEELVKKFYPFTYTAVHAHKTSGEYADAKQCALIAVEHFVYFIESHNNEWFGWNKDLQYWQEVKQEIEKL